MKDNLGLLTKVKGKVQNVEYANGIVESITVDDGSGEIRIFIDGYIGRPNSEDMKMPEIKKRRYSGSNRTLLHRSVGQQNKS